MEVIGNMHSTTKIANIQKLLMAYLIEVITSVYCILLHILGNYFCFLYNNLIEVKVN